MPETMPVTKPTVWPTVFPPTGGYEEVGAIADYLNEPIQAARLQMKLYRAEQGLPPPTSADFLYLPLYPRDGWWRRRGYPDFQIISPTGLGGFGQHEFQGHPEIRARVSEMLALAISGAMTPPTPPTPEPPTPEPEEPPVTVEPAPMPTCPEGQYYNVFTQRCEPIAASPIPESPLPPPTSGQDLRFGKFNISIRYDATKYGAGTGPGLAWPQTPIVGAFTFFSPHNWEAVAKWADLTPIGLPHTFFVAPLTDVPFVVKIRNIETGAEMQGEYPGDLKALVLALP